MAQDVIPSIAERYHVSEEAVRQVEKALRSTGGVQAQFNHPDLGGYGQWMPGMIMVGRMGDEQLRNRVAGLCAEVATIVRGLDSSGEKSLARDLDTGAAGGCAQVAAGESWWPATFGHANSAGAQNGIRYAYFGDQRRLLVQVAGRIDAYDTGEHRIGGVAQQQSSGAASRLTFTSQLGEVRLDQLRCLPHGEWADAAGS